MKKLRKRIAAAFSKVGTLNIILLIVFGFFLFFNHEMLQIFRAQGSIPESYACAVIAATIGECGICGWIRTTKDKKKDHDQERADIKEDRAWEEARRKEDEE